jgi:hypothetical protein
MNHYPNTRGKFVIANADEDMIAACNTLVDEPDSIKFYGMLYELAGEDEALALFLEMIRRGTFTLYPGVSADGKDIQLLY